MGLSGQLLALPMTRIQQCLPIHTSTVQCPPSVTVPSEAAITLVAFVKSLT